MTLKVSTGLRDGMLGNMVTGLSAYLIGTDGALVDGGESADTITDSGESFVTAGFVKDRPLILQGATTSANDTAVTGVYPTSVAAGTITVPTGTVNTAQAFAAGTVLCQAQGGSLRDIMLNGKLCIYSGSQPATADTAYSGTLLLTLTVDSGAWTAGSETNGIDLTDPSSGTIGKSTDVWSGAAVATGTAGWFRWYANGTDAGALSTSLPRIDGSCGTSGADLVMATTTITSGQTYTLDTFTLTFPAYYGA